MPRLFSGISSSEGLSESFGQVSKHVQAFVEYLQLPSRSEYWTAMQETGRHVYTATVSVNQLSYLTFRPLLLFLWLVSQKLYIIGRFLFRNLFQGLYLSIVNGFQQAKWMAQRLGQWQYSLSRREVAMEVGVVVVAGLLFFLRRHIQQQLYVQRVTRWYRVRQQRVIKLYRSTLDRISRTSMVLAMLLPHALFVGVCLTVKLLFPTAIAWVARDTYAIFILSTLYPWIWTVALLFQYRHPQADVDKDAIASPTNSSKTKTTTPTSKTSSTPKRIPLSERSSPASKRLPTPTKVSYKSALSKTPPAFSRTAPKTPAATSKKQPPQTPVQLLLAASRGTGTASNYSMYTEANYWMQYWVVYCLFTGLGSCISFIPIFGRIAARSTWLQYAGFEFQLMFYLWVFGLSSVLTSTASSDADMERTYLVRPLPFLMKRISPVLQRLYKATSEELITPALWATVVEKAKSFLSLAVMVRIISERTQQRLLGTLSEAHPFVVPAISLLLPSFFTHYGVLYVKTIVPAAKASSVKLSATSLEKRMVTLQYWVVHVIVSGTLTWWAGLLWWIPFSTHFVFLLWCHLQVVAPKSNILTPKENAPEKKPKGEYYYYAVLEEELQAFGLLPQGTATKVMAVEHTVTATLFRRLTKSLPSASSDNLDTVGEDENSGGEASAAVKVPPAAAFVDKSPDEASATKKASSSSKPDKKENPDTGNDSSASDSSASKLRRSTRARKAPSRN